MIENHDKERFLLARRLKLLSIFNDIAENDYGSYEDFNEHPDVQYLKNQFENVLTPKSLCASIKAIYPRRDF
jgi:hypothetical protein